MSDQYCNKCGTMLSHRESEQCLACQTQSELAAPAGSLAHVHFEITTAGGNRAVIKGDPEMPEATRNALAQMIDALAKSVERGDFKKPENAALSGAVGDSGKPETL